MLDGGMSRVKLPGGGHLFEGFWRREGEAWLGWERAVERGVDGMGRNEGDGMVLE
jgi:hypothetical protein